MELAYVDQERISLEGEKTLIEEIGGGSEEIMLDLAARQMGI